MTHDQFANHVKHQELRLIG